MQANQFGRLSYCLMFKAANAFFTSPFLFLNIKLGDNQIFPDIYSIRFIVPYRGKVAMIEESLS